MSPDRPQKVQVFALGRPRAGAERRYYLKWRVEGRDKTRSFRTSAEADRFRIDLLTAVHDGKRFDLETCVRAAWLPSASPLGAGDELVDLGADALTGRYSCSRGCRSFR